MFIECKKMTTEPSFDFFLETVCVIVGLTRA